MLKVDNLYVSYGPVKALSGVSLEIEEGSIVSLLGPNGAGKTTTLKTICGFLKPDKGKVIFSDRDITGHAPEDIVRLGISMVPEGRRIFPELTVKENLILGTYIRKDKKESLKDLDKIYSYFPVLKERENQLAGTLSGGEQQMLAIGRALMSNPKILLLDEPSLGLAPILVQEIFSIIKEINKSGVSVLLVEQNAYQALKISNYSYILEVGKIAFEGKSEELLKTKEVRKYYLGR